MFKELTKKDAIKYLGIPDKDFENYFKFSKELEGYQKKIKDGILRLAI